MSKPIINDKVAVLKVHPDTDTKYIVLEGTLSALDRGRKTEDKRANAEQGEVSDGMDQDAKGWCIVTAADGKRNSFPTKDVVLFTQKVVLEHQATMAAVATVTAERAAQEKLFTDAQDFCAAQGLDVTTLTAPNLFRIVDLLKPKA